MKISHFLAVQEEYVLEHIAELLDCLRSCNVTLRWLLLHAATRHRKLRPIVAAAAAEPPDALLGLLLDTALVESRVRMLPAAEPELLPLPPCPLNTC